MRLICRHCQRAPVLSHLFTPVFRSLNTVKNKCNLHQIWWQLNCHGSWCNLLTVLFCSIVLIWRITASITGSNALRFITGSAAPSFGVNLHLFLQCAFLSRLTAMEHCRQREVRLAEDGAAGLLD